MYGDRPPREDHEVTCAECGTQTTVPFKPRGDRPVKCRDCFQKDRPPRREGGFGGGRGGGGGGFGDRPPREMHDATCTNCGVQTQVPFRPTPGRDVFCRDCFRR
ncbi:MAG: CxxC-x17-CxxC domain-containing protein [Thermoplasmatota archaeon]